MKILVLCESYPSVEDKYAMTFVHPRIKGYIDSGLNVSVLSFSTKSDYEYEGVNVCTETSALSLIKKEGDILIISHAPNIKNHILFLFRIWKKFSRIIYVFHGHEILSTTEYYPIPYNYNKKTIQLYKKISLYDYVKLPIMKWFINRSLKDKSCDLIFVSQWMLDAGCKSLGLALKENILPQIHIINNTISSHIKEANYKLENCKADFITIRPLDGSKYAVDLVIKFAEKNPNYTFHIYGKGDYFKYNIKPENVIIINDFILQENIPTLLNSYKYAIMPTRLDAQGVMMCEMAAYGIPIIVSDLPVCHEMLDSYENVMFLDNNCFDVRVDNLPHLLSRPVNKFSFENTISKEIKLVKKKILDI